MEVAIMLFVQTLSNCRYMLLGTIIIPSKGFWNILYDGILPYADKVFRSIRKADSCHRQLESSSSYKSAFYYVIWQYGRWFPYPVCSKHGNNQWFVHPQSCTSTPAYGYHIPADQLDVYKRQGFVQCCRQLYQWCMYSLGRWLQHLMLCRNGNAPFLFSA